MNVRLQQAGVGVLALVFWTVGDIVGLFNPDVIPPILEVAGAIGTAFSREEFLPALWFTLRDSLASVALAALIAVPLGLCIGVFRTVEISTRILLDFGRTFPAIALIPIFILIIGTNHTTKIILTTVACFFPILLQTIYGARRLDPTIIDTVAGFRIPPLMRFRKVIFPSSMPFIATGLRLSLSISILVAVAVEVFTQVPGVGALIGLAQTYNETALAFFYVLVSGVMGVAVTGAWDVAEHRLLGWHHRGAEL